MPVTCDVGAGHVVAELVATQAHLVHVGGEVRPALVQQALSARLDDVLLAHGTMLCEQLCVQRAPEREQERLATRGGREQLR